MKQAVAITWRALRAYSADNASSYAAAVAYYMLFSLFPFALFFISFSGYFITRHQRDELVVQVSRLFGGASTTAIYDQIQTATNGRAGLGLIGLIGALWAASSVFGAIRAGLNAVWHVQDGRSWWLAKILDLASVISLGGMLGLALATTIVLTTVTTRAGHLFGAQFGRFTSFGLAAAFFVLPIILAFATFLVLYVLASPSHIRLRHVWLGALTSAAGYQALGLGFGLYVRYFAHYDRVYGSIGAAIAFLFFAYLLGSVILLGAEISEAYMEWATGRGSPGKANRERARTTEPFTGKATPARRTRP